MGECPAGRTASCWPPAWRSAIIWNKPSFQIRRGTTEDVPKLLDLHYRIFGTDSNYLMMLGRPFMDKAFRWYCKDKHAFALVAENGPDLAGYIAANRGSYYYMLRENWFHVLRAFLRHPKLFCSQPVLQRFRNLLRLHDTHGPEVPERACLAYIAIEREHRFRGAGSALTLAALQECHRRGWTDVITSFHSSNTPARMLFVMLGFKYFPELNHGDLVCVRFDTKNLKLKAPVVATAES